jgi:hypothetical protein
VLSLVATIKTINEQIKQLERQIATAIREQVASLCRCKFPTAQVRINSYIIPYAATTSFGLGRGRVST